MIDLIGYKVARIEVIEDTGKKDGPNGKGNRIWKCQCACGNTIEFPTRQLTGVGAYDCGCVDKEKEINDGWPIYSFEEIWEMYEKGIKYKHWEE